MYEYKAHVTSVYDADTITADIDLGFKAALKGVKLRLYSIDAPEMRGQEKEQGRISRDWLRERILGKDVFVRTYKDQTGKYGRWLAEIYPLDDQRQSYNAMLVAEGLAKPAFYT
ncbi:thermonuclease [Roseibium sp. TrichSKD4]|nr:thermonuclease [Roseibium sp. TrichSKD4]